MEVTIILILIKYSLPAFALFLVSWVSYKEGKKDGYTDAVRDVMDTGKFKPVEEVYK